MSSYEDEKLGKIYDSSLIRQLVPYIKPYLKQAALAIFCLLVASLCMLSRPKLIQVGIDDYIAQGDLTGLRFITGIFISILLIGFFARYAQMYLMEWIGQRIMLDLRERIFSHLQHLSLTFFNRNPVGYLMTRVTSDVQALNELFTSGLVAIFGDIVTLIGIFILLFIMNWKLAAIIMIVLPLLFMATIIFKQKVRISFRMIRTRIAKINANMQENIAGMTIVQLFNRQKKNYAHFENLNRDHLEAFLNTIFYFAIFYPLIEVIQALTTALIIWYGGMNIIQQQLSFGELVAFLQYAIMFYRPINDLSEKFNILQQAMAASERIFKLLDNEFEEGYATNGKHNRTIKGKIDFSEVWFAYKKEEWVLRDVSFSIEPGEKIAIVGATGAGKSTIINLLGRFYNVQKGHINIDGRHINDYSLVELRRQTGIVLQDVFLFAGSIIDNIRLGDTSISDETVYQAARDVSADSFINDLPGKYNHVLQERGTTLSVGQRQLLAFARALAFNPAILVLDEATSSVDTETEILIQKALKRLMANRTSIIIAHRISTIQDVDKIIVMHKGKIREMGSHAQLLAAGDIYSRLYQLQFAAPQVPRTDPAP